MYTRALPGPLADGVEPPPLRCASEGDAVVTGLPARLEGVIGQRHGDDRIGRMPAPEQIVFPAVQVLGIERPTSVTPLELVVGCARRELPHRVPAAGRVMLGRPRIFIEEGADLLGHGQP